MQRKIILSLAAFCAVSLSGFGQKAKSKPLTPAPAAAAAFSVQGKQVAVYTTAEKTQYRLSNTENLEFSYFGQPKEDQACIFVDPGKTFQTFLGVGGAITDASAEVFAKLPVASQKELLKSYYDPKDGIG